MYVFITAVPITKLFAWGEGDSGGHVLRETTSRGLGGLVCPSRTSERGGKGDCVKEGGGEEGSARGNVHWGYDYATALNIEVDPHRRRFGRRKSDFALQVLVECRALESERVRLVALRWHSSGTEVRLGLPVGLQKKKTPKFAVHACGCPCDGGEKIII